MHAAHVLAAAILAANIAVPDRAWAAATADPVTARGLKSTELDRKLVEAAIERTNLLIIGIDIRLQASWVAGAPDSVPVYLVKDDGTAAGTPAAVPQGCRCVFVNPSRLSAWVAAQSRGKAQMRLDRGSLLIFMLLHEAGHLSKGTPAAAFDHGALSQLNIDPSKAKANEEDADEFAARVLSENFRHTPANTMSLTANEVVTELVKLSWNMQAYRTLEEFGASQVGKPSVYFDNGYSHPNLAWRVLRCNYLIHQNAASKDLLDQFEAARLRGANRQPIYERKDSGR